MMTERTNLMTSGSRILLLSVLLVLLLSDVVRGQATVNPKELHGGIEISPKVVRVIALRISDGANSYNVKVLYSDSVIPTAIYPKDGKLTAEYVQDIAATAQKLIQHLQSQYSILLNQIYLIGLSDLIAQNPEDLVREVRKKTGKTMVVLNPETEVQLSIAGIIPRRYQLGGKWHDNRSISVLLDIGNSSVRGGYQQLRRTAGGRSEYDYVTWEIPKGTANFFAEVTSAVGESADPKTFARQAQRLSNEDFKKNLRMDTARKPGLVSRKKIYVTGGILWAMGSLLYADDQRPAIPITVEDIHRFYLRALTDPESLFNPDLSKIHDEAIRSEARRTREAVKAAFTQKSLLAGIELLRTLASELDFANRQVIYIRYSYLARILSYVRLQPE